MQENSEVPHPKKCHECHAAIYLDALFCPRCGAKVQRLCHQCGVIVGDSHLFCHKCGASLNHFQPIPMEALLKAAEAVAHRINNALSIVLTNSQLATRRITDLSRNTSEELQQYLQDIAEAADGGGSVIRQFQAFLDSIMDGYSQEENSPNVNQLVSNLRVPSNLELPAPHVTLESKETTRVGHVSILIVDDEEKIRHALSYALTLGGHHVITASDGQEALALVQDGLYDVAFVDLKMQGMDGWEVSSAIKNLNPDTIVVLMTGWSIRANDERLKENHIDAIITKPFELSQINDMVTAVGNRGKI